MSKYIKEAMDKFNKYSWMLCPWLETGVNKSNKKLWKAQILRQNPWMKESNLFDKSK